MNWKKMLVAVVTVFIILIPFSVKATLPDPSPAASLPWKREVVQGDIGSISNLSVEFIGESQISILVYTIPGSERIYYAYNEIIPGTGNCGLNDSWFCGDYNTYTRDVDHSLSNIAAFANPFETNQLLLRLTYLHESNFLMRVNGFYDDDLGIDFSGYAPIIDLNIFGDTLIGVPSQLQEPQQLSITTYGDGMYKLVYRYFSGVVNPSCGMGKDYFQCDVIDSSMAAIGPPSLAISPIEEVVGIAYTKAGSLYYAHPVGIDEGNCGPADSWRCAFIHTSGPDTFVVDGVDLEIQNTMQVAFLENKMNTSEIVLNLAKFVGKGYGNCGEFNDWWCEEIESLGEDTRDYAFSLEIDPLEYPVIAYSYLENPLKLGLAYPTDRTGVSPGNCDNSSWFCQEIAGSSGILPSSYGELTTFALSTVGLGFISYLQRIPSTMRTDLMISYQEFTTYMPLITH